MTGHGGSIIAEVLKEQGVSALFTLCGGHISPILVGAADAGIRVVDCRDERSAVFAADAHARLTGNVGVVAVTAGPGVTNTITALKNAELAETPLVLFGGATATLLKGRGALQDIDQMAVIRGSVKAAYVCHTVPALRPIVERAIAEAKGGVPGPVFIEVPVDVLYPEPTVREWYAKEAGGGDTFAQKALALYLRGHLFRQFSLPQLDALLPKPELSLSPYARGLKSRVAAAAAMLARAKRPVLIVGNQTMVGCTDPSRLARAVQALGVPVWLGGSARGLLGKDSRLQFRHARSAALKRADLVIVCGFPFDFRLKYGRGFGRAKVVSVNLSAGAIAKNRQPDLGLQMHPGEFLLKLEALAQPESWDAWLAECRTREDERDAEIARSARTDGPLVDPVHFFRRLEAALSDDAVLVVDGGDFVATAAYVLKPRRPLSWLDPGVFGTLGVGGGFAIGAAAARPGAQVWIIYGDGSSAYSLAEFDTAVRHGMAPIAVVGTDASWQQIARDQVSVLGSAVGTELRRTDYHKVVEGYGGKGLLLDDPARIDAVLAEAQALAKQGTPVCINVHLRKSDFREGSISI